MVSERVNDGCDRDSKKWFTRAAARGKNPAGGGARKTEDLKPQEWLIKTRALLAELTNKALARAGFTVRVDHRSLVEQGVTNRTPGEHLGPAGTARLRRGVGSRRWDELTTKPQDLITETQRVERELTNLGWSPQPTLQPVPIQSKSIQKRSNSSEFESPST